MRRVVISNFRGIQDGSVDLHRHSLLVGGNNIGKSTICEAIDLVLGPERLFRRPVIDEHDFYRSTYLPTVVGGDQPEVEVEVILTGLTHAAQRRFRGHLRKWSIAKSEFADVEADESEIEWALPVKFVGRFETDEEDFVGGTFFSHPVQESVRDDGETLPIGSGLAAFTREHKRHCGFLYLRAHRTGNRALSFQRGSLIDIIVRLEAERFGPLWEQALGEVRTVRLVNDVEGFTRISESVRSRVGRFIKLIDDASAIDIGVSSLTREHLREVLTLFVAAEPGGHGVPFNRLSTGSLNLIVFAMLTYIAELKGESSVIFAMEEPEIALPPHAQRRLVDFITSRMGQSIVTTHSPYVISRFDPDRIVALTRVGAGELRGRGIELPGDFKIKRYKENVRQFSEAVLARAVLVVEGATEAALLPVVADVLDRDPAVDYVHPDLLGLSIFDAGNDVSVPAYAPVFSGMQKIVYGIHDTPRDLFKPEVTAKSSSFDIYRVIPHKGVEDLLVSEVSIAAQRRFLDTVKERPDYPVDCGLPDLAADDATVRNLVDRILRARKGSSAGYAALLVAECHSRVELPASIVDFLLEIDQHLRAGHDITDLMRPEVDDLGA
ncbi:MAG: ATP-dependent nuclease [Pseudonocardia sp.]